MRRILVGASLRFGGRRIVRARTERDLSKIAHTSRPHRRANSAQDHVDVLGRDTCVPQSFEPRPAAAVKVRACALLVVAAAGVHQHGKAVPPDQEALDGDDQDSARRVLKTRHEPSTVLIEMRLRAVAKISNGDKIGPSYSTMRRSVESPNVQCDWADIERQTYQSRPWQSTAAPGISRHFDAAHELSSNQIEADIGGDKRTMIMPKPPSAPSRTEPARS